MNGLEDSRAMRAESEIDIDFQMESHREKRILASVFGRAPTLQVNCRLLQ